MKHHSGRCRHHHDLKEHECCCRGHEGRTQEKHGRHKCQNIGRFMKKSGFPGGRRLSSSDLQLVVLSLLEEETSHGYQLIKKIEQKSEGFYIPSPGVIYPALTYLEDVGYAVVSEQGTRKKYGITPEGKGFLAEHRPQVDDILDAFHQIGLRMEEVRSAFSGGEAGYPDLGEEFNQARMAFKHALKSKKGCDAEEVKRLIQILQRATEQITSGVKEEK